jgi:hypothetical protein
MFTSFKIYQHKNHKKIEIPQNKENAFSKIVFDTFVDPKLHEALST